jgi:hypothetical protein
MMNNVFKAGALVVLVDAAFLGAAAACRIVPGNVRVRGRLGVPCILPFVRFIISRGQCG